MKQTDKFDNTAEIIMDELSIADASASYDAAFQRGYEQIMELPAPKAKRSTGRIIGFASSCAAAFIVGMFILNAANPVLAESLPLVGSIFKAVNGSAQEGTVDNKNLVLDELQSVAQQPADTDKPEIYVKGTGTLETGLTFQVSEFYYDGYFLHIGNEIIFDTIPEDAPGVYVEGELTFNDGESYSFGNIQEPYLSVLDPTPYHIQDGRLLHTLSVAVPDEYQELEQLVVRLRITRVVCIGDPAYYCMEENTQGEVLSLTAVNGEDSDAVTIDTPVTINGYTIKSATRTFTGAVMSFEGLVDTEEVHLLVMCNVLSDETPGQLNFDDDGRSGPRKILFTTQEDVVICTVRNKQSETLDVLAEFTINFAEGTIVPSEHYLTEDGPSYYDTNDFTYGYFRDEREEMQEDFYLNRVFASSDNVGYIEVGTNLDYKELRMEAYRDDTMVASVRAVDYGPHADLEEKEAMYIPNDPDAGTVRPGKGRYGFGTILDGTEYTLSKDHTLMVKIYDGITDELLYEETQPLGTKYYYSELNEYFSELNQ